MSALVHAQNVYWLNARRIHFSHFPWQFVDLSFMQDMVELQNQDKGITKEMKILLVYSHCNKKGPLFLRHYHPLMCQLMYAGHC